MDFGFYFKVFLRRLPYFLIFLALGAAAGITLAVMLPPVYRAQATLLMESEQIPDSLAASTVRTNPIEQLQIIRQRLMTREVLLEMANRMEVYADTGRAPMTADAKVDDMRKRITIALNAGKGQARIITVGFEAPNGPMAARVTNELVTLILQESLDMRTTVAGQTLDFFDQEVARLDREMSRQSAAILEFKEKNLNAMPDSLAFRRSQQAAQQERLLQLERGESVLRDRRDRLVTLYESTGQLGAETPLTPEMQRLRQMEAEYDNLLAVLAPTNPKVTLLKNRIDALKKNIEAGAASAASDQPTAPAGLSPYELQMADIDGQLDYIAEQKARIQETLEALEVSIEQTPANAVALEAMERENSNLRARYSEAMANRGRAETGDTIESLSKGRRITVVEQATTPRQPVSPNRPLIAAGGIGAGLAFGLALVLLLELLNTSVRRPRDLTAKLGITPFGTVPYIWTGPQLARRRTVIAAAFIFALAVIPAGLWLVDTQVTPIQPLIGRILDRLNLDLAAEIARQAQSRFS